MTGQPKPYRSGPRISPSPSLETRASSDGSTLPVAGLILDPNVSLELDDAVTRTIPVGDDEVQLLDGVVNDRWHFVIAHRDINVARRHSAFIKALHTVGVRQVLSATFAGFDLAGYSASINRGRGADDMFIDLSGAPPTSMSAVSTSCGRLLTGLVPAIRAEEFDLLPQDMAEFIESSTHREMVTATALGMCFAAIDVMNPPTEEFERSLRTAMPRTLQRALDSVSPLATCLCPTGPR